MTDLMVVPHASHWQRLKRMVLDSVSSPITRRVYNLGLDEFFEWYGRGSWLNQAKNSSSPRLYTRRVIGEETLLSTRRFSLCQWATCGTTINSVI